MTTTRTKGMLLALAAGALVAVGCGRAGSGADPEFTEASPDFDGLAMELEGDDGSNDSGALSSPLEVDASIGAALETDRPALYPVVRDTVRGINRVVARFVRRVEALVATSPDVATGTTHTWTRVEGALEYRFTMNKAGERRFSRDTSSITRRTSASSSTAA